MLISTVTCWLSITWPARSFCGDGSGGGFSWTNFAPNTVVDVMSTSDVGRDEMQSATGPWPGAARPSRPAASSIVGHLAHLHAAHLHLGVGVHHQAGAIRNDRHRNGFGEAAAEQS